MLHNILNLAINDRLQNIIGVIGLTLSGNGGNIGEVDLNDIGKSIISSKAYSATDKRSAGILRGFTGDLFLQLVLVNVSFDVGLIDKCLFHNLILL